MFSLKYIFLKMTIVNFGIYLVHIHASEKAHEKHRISC